MTEMYFKWTLQRCSEPEHATGRSLSIDNTLSVINNTYCSLEVSFP